VYHTKKESMRLIRLVDPATYRLNRAVFALVVHINI
jgi:hypothetical protein